MCFLNETNIEECDVNNSPASLSGYKYVFILGQLLHGAGATPLYTLGVTYLDENLKAKNTPVYVGKVKVRCGKSLTLMLLEANSTNTK